MNNLNYIHFKKYSEKPILIFLLIIIILGIISMSVVLYTPNDFRGYGNNNVSNVQVFSTSNDGAAINPMIPAIVANTVGGAFSLFVQNPNSSLILNITIIGANYLTVKTQSGNLLANSADSPVTLAFNIKSTQWFSSTGIFYPFDQNIPPVTNTNINKLLLGYSMTNTDDYIFGGSLPYKLGVGGIFVWRVADLAAGNLTPFRTIAGVTAINTNFGYSIAANSRYLVVGSPNNNSNKGATTVFEFNLARETWTIKQTLVASPTVVAFELQGYSVAISEDSMVIATSAIYADLRHGAINIFRLNVDSQQYEYKSTILISDTFPTSYLGGYKVKLSADGLTLATSEIFNLQGSIFIYTGDSTGVYTLQYTSLPVVVLGSVFGTTLDLSATGDTLIVGFDVTTFAAAAGTVYVYNRVGGVWTLDFNLTPTISPPIAADNFPAVVKLSRDGTKILASGIYYSNYSGAVWTFELSGGVWTNTDFYTNTSQRMQLGFSLGMSSGDGAGANPASNFEIYGCPFYVLNSGQIIYNRGGSANSANNKYLQYNLPDTIPTRSIYTAVGQNLMISADNLYIASTNYDFKESNIIIFKKSGGSWLQKTIIKTGIYNNALDLTNQLGAFVALSSSANKVVVLELFNSIIKVYNKSIVYSAPNDLDVVTDEIWTLSATITPAFLQSYNLLTMIPNGNVFAYSYPDPFNGAIEVFDFIGGVWVPQIVTAPVVALIQFGGSFALSNDGLTLVVTCGIVGFDPYGSEIHIFTRAAIGAAFTETTTIPAPAETVGLNGVAGSYVLSVIYSNTVTVYLNTGALWNLTATILPPPTPTGVTFASITLVSQNTQMIVVSGSYTGSNFVFQRCVFIYSSRNAINWTLLKTITNDNWSALPLPPGYATFSQFGAAMSMSSYGSALAISNYQNFLNGGDIYVYT